jgi:Subtilase family
MSSIFHDFQHLNLSLKIRDRAHLHGGGRPDPRTSQNNNNRATHGAALQASGRNLSNQWKTNLQDRQRQNLPEVPPGIPFLLKIDPTELDLDFLYTMFNLEVVSEQEDGYVLVASGDFELEKFFSSLEKFVGNVSGGGGAAKIYALHEDTDSRLKRILSDHLYQNWPTINDNQVYTVEIGIECLGIHRLTDPPEKKDTDTEDSYQHKLSRWKSKADNIYQQLDQLRIDRESTLQKFVDGYNGSFLSSFIDGETNQVSNLPDSFTTKIAISGKGLKDLVHNYPFIFEVTEPDDIGDDYLHGQFNNSEKVTVQLIPPDNDAPTVCVIDSGIQEGHRYLSPAIDSENSFNYISEQSADVGDGVQPAGHGTRVAGAILYPKTFHVRGCTNFLAGFKMRGF